MSCGIMSDISADDIEEYYINTFEGRDVDSDDIRDFIGRMERIYGYAKVPWNECRQMVGYLILREGHDMDDDLHQMIRRAIGEEVEEIDGKRPTLMTHINPAARREVLCEFADQVCQYYGKQKAR